MKLGISEIMNSRKELDISSLSKIKLEMFNEVLLLDLENVKVKSLVNED